MSATTVTALAVMMKVAGDAGVMTEVPGWPRLIDPDTTQRYQLSDVDVGKAIRRAGRRGVSIRRAEAAATIAVRRARAGGITDHSDLVYLVCTAVDDLPPDTPELA